MASNDNFSRHLIVEAAEELVRADILNRLTKNPLYIHAVEITQAIQYCRARDHFTDPADRGDDNSVQLVVNKPAWVRVYVRSIFSDISGVTGTVEVQRRQFGILYSTVTMLSPQSPGTITAHTNFDYVTERGNRNSSLNFIIPAEYTIGFLRLKVRINAGSISSEREVYLNVTLRQTVRLAGIMIGYNGSNGNLLNPMNITLNAPTITDLQNTSPYSLTIMPVQSNATYRIAGTITWNTPLTDAPTSPGGCSPNWGNLNNQVQQTRINDGNRTDVIYYGLLAVGVPMGPVIGCNTLGGVSTGTSGDQITMAHEIGHYVGLRHGPCGNVGSSADPNYPAYEPYSPPGTPNASIGEYGLNINNGDILSPETFRDYMSYCAPRWVSLFHYGKMLNNTLLDPTIVGVDHPFWEEYIIPIQK